MSNHTRGHIIILLTMALLFAHHLFGEEQIGLFVFPDKQKLMLFSPQKESVLPFLNGLILGLSGDGGNTWINLNMLIPWEKAISQNGINSYVGEILGISDILLKLKSQQLLSDILPSSSIWIRIEMIPLSTMIVKSGTNYIVQNVTISLRLESPQGIDPETIRRLNQIQKKLEVWINHSPLFSDLRALISGASLGKYLMSDQIYHGLSQWAKNIGPLPTFFPQNILWMSVYSHYFLQSQETSPSGGLSSLIPEHIYIIEKNPTAIERILSKNQNPFIIEIYLKHKMRGNTPFKTCPICGSSKWIQLSRYRPIIYDIKGLGRPENYPEELQCDLIPETGIKTKKVWFTIVQCMTCSHIFVEENPSDSDLSFTYNFLILQQTGKLEKRIRDKAQYLQSQLKDLLKNVPPGGTIVDVGSGLGVHVLALRSMGYNAIGIEPNTTLSEFSNRNLYAPTFDTTLERLALPDNCVDAVTMFTVLEHVKDPLSLLREAWRILKPNGILLISDLPNLLSYVARAQNMEDFSYHDLKIGHIHFFTCNSIKYALSQIGFTDIKINTGTKLRFRKKDLSPDDYEMLKKIIDQAEKVLEESGDLISVIATKKDYSNTVSHTNLKATSIPKDLSNPKIIYHMLPDYIKMTISLKEFLTLSKDLFLEINSQQDAVVAIVSLFSSLNLSNYPIYKKAISHIPYLTEISPKIIHLGTKTGQKILSLARERTQNNENKKGGISL